MSSCTALQRYSESVGNLVCIVCFIDTAETPPPPHLPLLPLIPPCSPLHDVRPVEMQVPPAYCKDSELAYAAGIRFP